MSTGKGTVAVLRSWKVSYRSGVTLQCVTDFVVYPSTGW